MPSPNRGIPTRTRRVSSARSERAKLMPPPRHTTEWSEQQIVALLRIHASVTGESLVNVVDGMCSVLCGSVGLDYEGVDSLLQTHLSRERAAKRKRIIAAAKKLTEQELDDLGISIEARDILFAADADAESEDSEDD